MRRVPLNFYWNRSPGINNLRLSNERAGIPCPGMVHGYADYSDYYWLYWIGSTVCSLLCCRARMSNNTIVPNRVLYIGGIVTRRHYCDALRSEWSPQPAVNQLLLLGESEVTFLLRGLQ